MVERAQAETMLESLHRRQNLQAKVHFLEATGQHDEIWRNGDILAGLIQKALEKTRFRSLVERSFESPARNLRETLSHER